MSCIILSYWCERGHKGLLLTGAYDVIFGALLHHCGNLRAVQKGPHMSLDVTGWQFAATRRSLIVRSDTEGWLRRGQSWSSVLRRVTPLPSSPYLCFPCKVWGFSKQTGGDKHMLWTVLCWVVSEVQQSRSLSSCGYTSHSEVDSRAEALLLPHL